MKIIAATSENFAELKGKEFSPHNGEGAIYIKLVALKPETIRDGDPEGSTNSAQGVVVFGRLNEIKDQFNKWLDQIVEEYQKLGDN